MSLEATEVRRGKYRRRLLAAAVAMLAFVPPDLGVVAACITTLAAGLGGAAMSIAVTVAVRSVPIQAAGTAAGLAVSAMHCTSKIGRAHV